jgi:hypothetical protein
VRAVTTARGADSSPHTTRGRSPVRADGCWVTQAIAVQHAVTDGQARRSLRSLAPAAERQYRWRTKRISFGNTRPFVSGKLLEFRMGPANPALPLARASIAECQALGNRMPLMISASAAQGRDAVSAKVE